MTLKVSLTYSTKYFFLTNHDSSYEVLDRHRMNWRMISSLPLLDSRSSRFGVLDDD